MDTFKSWMRRQWLKTRHNFAEGIAFGLAAAGVLWLVAYSNSIPAGDDRAVYDSLIATSTLIVALAGFVLALYKILR